MKKKIRVLIADDHAIVRMGLASLLNAERDIEVVGEAENGEVAIRKAIKLRPDVLVMDLIMPKKDGSKATAEILDTIPDTKVLLLTSFGTSDGIAHALAAGATGALMKNTDFTEFVSAIRIVASGGRAVSKEIDQLIADDPPVLDLTQRQQEILSSLARGLTNADIAKQFTIRESSVKDHLTAIFTKLGAANRSEAISIALRKHLLKL
ncbi:MAG: response regulator transcription factor [Kiritimatiellae bacterium]|nr:response regulator transcription factor [Kiritimatiellia bacterium]